MVSKKLNENKEKIIDIYNNTSDLVTHEFETHFGVQMMVCYIDGFINKDILDRDIIRPLIFNLDKTKNIKKVIYVSQIEEVDSIENVAAELPNGKVSIFAEGLNISYFIDLSNWQKRAIAEPQAESVVRGSKEGFIEDIFTNKAMLRRRIRNSNLVFEDYTCGKQTRTQVSLAYIQGVVNEAVLKELKKRLQKIDIDGILESGYIEQLIEDSPMSLISTIGNSEKPDVVAGKILEGRVAIFTDGTPHVLTVPRVFVEKVMSSEDYYLRTDFGSFLRLLRAISVFIAIYSPGVFVALQLYHQEMIPTVLLVSMAGSREGVPLPVAVETFLMTLTLELTKESGLRLPKSIGSTANIVGALVLGQAAVQAGFVSAATVIMISITALAQFTIPELVEEVSIYRLIMIILGGLFGLYGISCGFIILAMEIVSLDSFGIPYGWPIAPRNIEGLKDSIIRFPIWQLIFRPEAIAKHNVKRQNPPRKG